ncbi:TadE/TadG family type IV pilus assembly protein [Desulfococcus multivorans]|uniref:TadE family protein n=1 Tax=Desulfococcus multivorans DSM 2059 TaxID=1121405 RepID=S7UML2_DESML|nr:TadE family protein [Desulfococcus multivorans]AOY58764.1 putative TadE family protein [Desulfococcus multivorans]EPR35194.1 TadE family protein [Desulfococcus multivorans DSM 2059]SJZ49695.1 TadE-like protein [Desulfococcus multivorans DSM 2059]
MLPKNQNGAAVLEFLIVLPILLLFLFGGIEFGAIFYNKQVLTNASREGARAGITREYTLDGIKHEYTEADIEGIVKNYWLNEEKKSFLLGFSPIDPEDIEVTVIPEEFTATGNEYLTVGVKIKDYNLIFASIMGLDILYKVPDLQNIINISASTTMRMEPKLN